MKITDLEDSIDYEPTELKINFKVKYRVPFTEALSDLVNDLLNRAGDSLGIEFEVLVSDKEETTITATGSTSYEPDSVLAEDNELKAQCELRDEMVSILKTHELEILEEVEA